MHYYQFNIGDYSSHTSRLSLMEDLAYRRLLDLYYLSEQPISGSLDDISRDIGMMDHIDEITYILKKFFILEENIWFQCRADKEIKHFQSKKDKASKAGKASGKARRSKAYEQTLNGRLTDVEPNIKQEPITNNHKPINKDQKTIRENSDEISTPKPISIKIPFKKIVELYHEILPTLPAIEKITKTREGFIRQRWIEDLPDLDHWNNYFDYIKQSDFLMGRCEPQNGKRIFRADLEWISKPSNFAKISEGKYHGE